MNRAGTIIKIVLSFLALGALIVGVIFSNDVFGASLVLLSIGCIILSVLVPELVSLKFETVHNVMPTRQPEDVDKYITTLERRDAPPEPPISEQEKKIESLKKQLAGLKQPAGFICKHCQKEFLTEVKLRRHIGVVHSDLLEI